MSTAREASNGKKVNDGTTGYKDRPWIPRFWDGMICSAWFPLLARNRFDVHLRRWGMAGIISVLALLNSKLAFIQSLLMGRRVRETELKDDPIFILGHWRAGTTLLHELLVLDERHTYPNTYECFAPNHFLLSGRFLPPLLRFLLPDRRPMDNMAAGWGRPQEDEFALCNMGIPSPYLTSVFPNRAPQYPEYLTLDRVNAQDLQRWKDGLLWLLKCLAVRSGNKRIVLKSPPHTCRIRVLLEMFPNARFVHIVRDPVVVFASTVNLWKRLYRDQGLQMPNYADLDERVFQAFSEMYEVFERDRHLIPANRYFEVRYEDLTKDILGQMRQLYDRLELGGFEAALPTMTEYVAGQKDYKTNRWEIAPELRAEIVRRWRPFFDKYGYPTEA